MEKKLNDLIASLHQILVELNLEEVKKKAGRPKLSGKEKLDNLLNPKVSKAGVKEHLKFNIYFQNIYIKTLVGVATCIKYIDEIMNITVTKNQFNSMSKVYNSENFKLKKKLYQRFNGLEIERV